jgi:hypothetical protein
MILNSPTISGSLTVTGNIIASGSITLSGSVASASYAATASFVALAQSASNAVAAATASFANAFTVAGNLTAQTLVVQTITSSVDFVTGSTRFGSLLGNTHVFSGSVTMNPGGLFVSSSGVVGINTTTPGYMLDISDGTQRITLSSPDPFNTVQVPLILSNGAGNGGAGSRLSFNIGGAIPWIQGLIDGANSNAGAALVFGTTGSAGTGIERMRITSGGNVGIGTTNPTAALEVSGSVIIGFNQSSLTRLIVRNTTAGTGAYVETTYTSDASAGSGAVGKFSSTSTTYKITTASNTYLYNGSTAGDISILNDFSSGAIKMAAGGSSTSHFTIASTGAATFSSTISSVGDITITKSSAASFIANNTSASGKSYRLVSTDSGQFIIQNTGILDLVYITSGGNVGIGTSPTYRLDVSGTVRIADGGRLYVNQLLPLGIVFRNDEFPDGDGNNTKVTDAQATNGDAKRRLSSAPSTTFFYGPYTTIPAGTYIAYFRLKVTSNASASNILYMDITNVIIPGGGITINPNSFTTSNRYQYFKIPFIVTDPTNVIEFRGLSFVSGITDLFLDHVMILPGS